jgi:hypothetical protein
MCDGFTFVGYMNDITFFCGWNSICHVSSHCCSDVRSLCKAAASSSFRICLYNRQSSAKSRTSGVVCSGKSFMKVKNSNGPFTVPCGTPDITSAQEDVTPSNTTFCVLLLKKSCTYFQVFPLTP